MLINPGRLPSEVLSIAFSENISPIIQNSIQTRFDRLGIANVDTLPMDAATPLPYHPTQRGRHRTAGRYPADAAPVAVALLKGDPALEKPPTEAIQSALMNTLPDGGPVKLLR